VRRTGSYRCSLTHTLQLDSFTHFSSKTQRSEATPPGSDCTGGLYNSFLFSPETAFKVWIWYLDNSWDSFLWKADRHQSL